MSGDRISSELLLRLARGVLAKDDLPSGLRERTAAMLGRHACEALLVEVLEESGVDPGASMRAKLLAARAVLEPEAVVALGSSWTALTSLCHHRPYELQPSRGEVERQLGVIGSVVE